MESGKTHVIETISFIGKLSDVYLFLDYALNAMDDPLVQKKALSKWMKGVPEMLRDERLLNKAAFPEKEFEGLVLRAEEGMKESYIKKFNESKKVVLNLSLVVMCTVMELFFEHVFNLICKANSRALLCLSKDKNITLEQFLTYATYDAALNEFIQKTTDHIIREGTKEVLKAFNNIGMKTAEIFSWDMFTEDVQIHFADWKDAKLFDIFQERHSIVHNNAMPIQSIEDLLLRQEFFTKIILNISVQTWHKFYKYGVILDYHEQIRRSIKAKGGDPSSYPLPPKNKEKG